MREYTPGAHSMEVWRVWFGPPSFSKIELTHPAGNALCHVVSGASTGTTSLCT